MTQIAPIKPFVTDDGIELYATDIECGMSQRGLARFCGVSSDSLFKLISNLTVRQNVPEILESFIGQDLTLSANFEKDAKVYKSNLCAAICTYYAYESKAANATAKYSLKKFAAMGIDSWIRKTTGHEQPAAVTLDPRDLAIQLLLENKVLNDKALAAQEALTVTTQRLELANGYITRSVIDAPGLKSIMDASEPPDTEYIALEGKREHYTLREWLVQIKELDLDNRRYNQLNKRVAEVFKTLRDRKPVQVYRTTPNGNNCRTYAYCEHDFPYLNTCLLQVI